MDTSMQAISLEQVGATVARVVQETPIVDMHTHLYSEQFGSIGLWGLDELINYHYLIAEIFRFSPISYQEFWAMDTPGQAEAIWKSLFEENSPLSESTRGNLDCLATARFGHQQTGSESLSRLFRSTEPERLHRQGIQAGQREERCHDE